MCMLRWSTIAGPCPAIVSNAQRKSKFRTTGHRGFVLSRCQAVHLRLEAREELLQPPADVRVHHPEVRHHERRPRIEPLELLAGAQAGKRLTIAPDQHKPREVAAVRIQLHRLG